MEAFKTLNNIGIRVAWQDFVTIIGFDCGFATSKFFEHSWKYFMMKVSGS